MYRLSTVVLRLAAAIGFSRVQGSTTGSLAAATTTGSLAAATEAHGSPGLGRVQGSLTVLAVLLLLRHTGEDSWLM